MRARKIEPPDGREALILSLLIPEITFWIVLLDPIAKKLNC
jgi:hypothetical protein